MKRPYIPQSATDNMPPDRINYKFIDPSLRNLIRKLNKTSWCATIGSCAGEADHGMGIFYIILEVKGLKGIRNFLRWMSLSHSLGYDAKHNRKTIKDFTIPRAGIISPNYLHGDFSATGALKGDRWIRFQLSLFSEVLSVPRIKGGIKALELGLNALSREAKNSDQLSLTGRCVMQFTGGYGLC